MDQHLDIVSLEGGYKLVSLRAKDGFSPSGVSWTELGVYGTKRQGSFTEYLQARFLDDDVRDVRDQLVWVGSLERKIREMIHQVNRNTS